MANWYGTARSNYFKVKDPIAFRTWADSRGLALLTHEAQPERFGITPGNGTDSGDWPGYDTDTDEEIDLPAEVAKHLPKGEIAILMECGAEKIRYVSGVALAINHKGRVVSISLHDIYAKAARTFRVPANTITPASY